MIVPDAPPPAGGAGGADDHAGGTDDVEMTLPGIFDDVRDDLSAGVHRAQGGPARAAARSMPAPVLSAQRARVLEAVVRIAGRHGPGATAFEVAEHLADRTQQSVVARRLADLEQLELLQRHRLLTRPGSTNRPLTVWLPTPAGRALVDDEAA